jgi:hypothetical protein
MGRLGERVFSPSLRADIRPHVPPGVLARRNELVQHPLRRHMKSYITKLSDNLLPMLEAADGYGLR